MVATTRTSPTNAKVTQLSPMTDIVVRLSEIRRRLKTAWVQCEIETHRNLIANAEHEICRSILLLEAEINRTDVDNASARQT